MLLYLGRRSVYLEPLWYLEVGLANLGRELEHHECCDGGVVQPLLLVKIGAAKAVSGWLQVANGNGVRDLRRRE